MNRESEEILNLNAWQLFHIARALTRATKLEKSRSDFHKELYESISCRTVNWDPLNPIIISTATDAQAIRIIESKERYDRLIQEEHTKHASWCRFLSLAGERDRLILIRYFVKKKSVKPEIILNLLGRLQEGFVCEEERIEQEREKRAKEEYRKYLDSVGRKQAAKRKLPSFMTAINQ